MFSNAVSIWAAFAITICFSKDKLCHLWLRCLFYMTEIWVHSVVLADTIGRYTYSSAELRRNRNIRLLMDSNTEFQRDGNTEFLKG